MVTKIGWFSDCHLGYAQYGSQERYLDMFAAVRDVISQMEVRGIREAICTGDLLHNTRPSPDTVSRLADLRHQLLRAGIQCVAMLGNHDLTVVPSWLDLEAGGWVRGNAGVISTPHLIGLDYRTPEQLKHYLWEQHGRGRILGLHIPVAEFLPFATEGMFNLDSLPLDGRFPAVLLGDIHICDVRQNAAGVVYGYPGSTELCSSSEPDVKYWIELELETEGEPKVVGFHKHVINTRKVWRRSVTSEAELQVLLKQLGELRDLLPGQLGAMGPHRLPLVYVSYDPMVPDVVTRINQGRISEHSLVRLQSLGSQAKEFELTVPVDAMPKIDIQALLLQSVPEGPVHSIVSRLLDPAAEARPLLQEFVRNYK